MIVLLPNQTRYHDLHYFAALTYYVATQDQRYLREFASRVDDLLQAFLEREALPSDISCGWCNAGRLLWRCEDCSFPAVLCRHCMRISHMANPFHCIECWTGTYFRRADLHEVGVYIVIGHRDNVVCPTVET